MAGSGGRQRIAVLLGGVLLASAAGCGDGTTSSTSSGSPPAGAPSNAFPSAAPSSTAPSSAAPSSAAPSSAATAPTTGGSASPPPSRGGTATSPTGSSTESGQQELAGTVGEGAAPGCVVLETPHGRYELLGASGLRPGEAVQVRGHLVAGTRSHCQQGRPFAVDSVRRS